MISVFESSYRVLSERDPTRKCALAAALEWGWQRERLGLDTGTVFMDVEQVGRPVKPELVHPRELPKRSIQSEEGRLALMHAIAHIEFNAINLACDAVHRFHDLPQDYYSDWIGVAADEARHFNLIADYLEAHGCRYGDYPAHDGLWDMAVKTQHDVLARMALVPRVLEARGLDVTPAMIESLRSAGDQEAAAILTTIYHEEIAHVAAGSRWFRYICEQRNLDSQQAFRDLVRQHFAGQLRGPFNIEARIAAGFDPEELEKLAGDL